MSADQQVWTLHETRCDVVGATTMPEDYSLGEVEVSLSPLERLEEFLQTKGMRITQPRRVIVEEVFRQHEHFDADKLMESLTKANTTEKVSRPTVYRALEVLVEAGLLRKMELGGRAVYEHDYGYPQHDHLHCQECNNLIEFRSEDLERIRDAVAQQHQFRVTGHRMIVTGVCSACLEKRRNKQRRLDRI